MIIADLEDAWAAEWAYQSAIHGRTRHERDILWCLYAAWLHADGHCRCQTGNGHRG